MGFVDGEDIRAGLAQQRLRIGPGQPFGRDIDEPVAPLPQALLDRGVVAGAVDGIQRRRRDATGAQLLHLVAHQGDQRRDDDGEAGPHDRRQLIAKRFAGAGRHHGENILAGENRLKDFRLSRPEVGKAEAALQRRAGVDHVVEQEVPGSHRIWRRAMAFLGPARARMANEMSRRRRAGRSRPLQNARHLSEIAHLGLSGGR